MFKITGSSGRRSAGGSGVGAVGRISASRPVRVSAAPGLRRVAFLPDTPQEQTFDSSSPRLQGLEAGH